jgi:hypothetical protein
MKNVYACKQSKYHIKTEHISRSIFYLSIKISYCRICTISRKCWYNSIFRRRCFFSFQHENSYYTHSRRGCYVRWSSWIFDFCSWNYIKFLSINLLFIDFLNVRQYEIWMLFISKIRFLIAFNYRLWNIICLICLFDFE